VNQYSELLNYLENIPKANKNNEIKKPIINESKNEIIKKNSFNEFSELNNGIPAFKNNNVVNNSKFFDMQLFIDNIKSKIIEKKITSQLYEKPYISVSEILGCERKIYFDRKKYSIDNDKIVSYPMVDIICEVGDIVHNYIQKIYPFDEIEKTIISKKYKIKGRVDAISKDVLYEIKTIDPKLSNISRIRQKDFDQANIYTEILNDEFGYSIHNIVIIYVPRDFKNIITLDILPNKHDAQKILEKASDIYQSINKNEIPSYNEIYKNDCKFCEFEEYCIKDKSKNKNIFLL